MYTIYVLKKGKIDLMLYFNPFSPIFFLFLVNGIKQQTFRIYNTHYLNFWIDLDSWIWTLFFNHVICNLPQP